MDATHFTDVLYVGSSEACQYKFYIYFKWIKTAATQSVFIQERMGPRHAPPCTTGASRR